MAKICECGKNITYSYVKNNGEKYFGNICNSCKYEKHKDKVKKSSRDYAKKRDNDPLKRIAFLIKEAEKRNKEWELSYDEAISFWNKECFYCGDNVEGLHLDRIDPKIGYKIDNIVSACGTCNIMKYTLSKNSFIDKCKKIYLNSLEVNLG